MLRKIISLFLVLGLAVMLFTGCASIPAESADENRGDAPELTEEPLKVGLVLPGPINDMGWNASAYEGLMKIEADYGADVLYVENINQSDMEEAFRNFAIQGYDLVFGHGFQFGDTATIVAEQYPDTKFVISSSTISNDLNLASVNAVGTDQGFLAGALAALLSESGQVGAIGGMDIPPIRDSLSGFVAGAKYVNPDIVISVVMTGSFDDVTNAKETAIAMIDRGVDVIFANANQAGLGSIEACKERGIISLGSNQDQNPIAPDTVVASVIKSIPRLFTFIVEEVEAGSFNPQFYALSINEDAIYFADWHGNDEVYPEAYATINIIIRGMAEGSIVYDASQYEI